MGFKILHKIRQFVRPMYLLLALIFIISFTIIVHYKDETIPLPPKRQLENLPALSKVLLTNYDPQNVSHFWFMKKGLVRPSHAKSSPKTPWKPLWLQETDRIIEQLMFVPPNLDEITNNGTKLKKILMYNGFRDWSPLKPGQETFLKARCPVFTCDATDNKNEAAIADAIVFQEYFFPPKHKRSSSQVWIFFSRESSLNNKIFNWYRDAKYVNVFNWTATYRSDSDIVFPYGKFIPYFELKNNYIPPQRNYALNKTGKVAWFVSNCQTSNNRLNYASQLSQYIEVDIYGKCGTKSCPQSQNDKCLELLDTKYKFYLSFENSNCKEYITEKFFVNGLSHDVVPIVMGAGKEDYLRVAPPNSFISVDDFDTVKDLADYLKMLDENDVLYNQYFRWKGTGELIETYFWCRLCAMLHNTSFSKIIDNIDMWWHDPEICER